MTTMGGIAPGAMDRMGPAIIRQQRRAEPPRNPEGALHRAGDDGRAHGDHPGYVMRRSLYTRTALHPALTGALVAAAGVAAAAVISQRSHNGRRSIPW